MLSRTFRTFSFCKFGLVAFSWCNDKVAFKVWAVLSTIIALLIFFYLIVYTIIFTELTAVPYRVSSFFDLGSDGSLPELFNYGMLFLSAIILMAVYFETGSRTAALFGTVMAFAWVDDSAQYHERMGRLISKSLDISPALGLRASDIGELLAWTFIMIVLGGVVIWARKNIMLGDNRVLVLMVSPLFALIISGGVFDMVNIIFDGPVSNVLLTVMEDGGEMLSIAWAAAASIYIYKNTNIIFYQK